MTEFDGLGDQGTGLIYLLNLDNGGVNGGVTGYARLGTLVGVTDVNVRTDTAPSPDQLGLIQDGRFYANAGATILNRQLQVWLGTATDSSLGIDEDPAFDAFFPTRRE